MTMKNVQKKAVATLYEWRKLRQSHPEGSFDRAGRWTPSDREDQQGDGSSTRAPSRAWPYSWLLRCRTKSHCKALILAALDGKDVPSDVTAALSAIAELED